MHVIVYVLLSSQTKDKMAATGKSVSLDEGIGSSVSTCSASKPSVATTSRGTSLSDDMALRHDDVAGDVTTPAPTSDVTLTPAGTATQNIIVTQATIESNATASTSSRHDSRSSHHSSVTSASSRHDSRSSHHSSVTSASASAAGNKSMDDDDDSAHLLSTSTGDDGGGK